MYKGLDFWAVLASTLQVLITYAVAKVANTIHMVVTYLSKDIPGSITIMLNEIMHIHLLEEQVHHKLMRFLVVICTSLVPTNIFVFELLIIKPNHPYISRHQVVNS